MYIVTIYNFSSGGASPAPPNLIPRGINIGLTELPINYIGAITPLYKLTSIY
jgi:hypothetical protein